MTALMTNSLSSPSHQGGVACGCSSFSPCGRQLVQLPRTSDETANDPPSCPFASSSRPRGQTPEPRLSANEERELFSELKRLQNELADRLQTAATASRRERLELLRISCQACSIRRHLGECFFKLAVSVARGFANQYEEIDDLVGQACVTLMRALDLFDVERGCRFSTYATRAMRTELARFVIRRRKRVDGVTDLRLVAAHPETVFHQRHPGPSVVCALEEFLDDLDDREADIVRSRFGLHDRPGCETLQAVADRLGISRERVRQLERLALEKLRRLAERDERVELFVATIL